ncbi:putative transporter [Yarrowia sp. B02]|nr:putative transporter [Yarrowia sp. B02]
MYKNQTPPLALPMTTLSYSQIIRLTLEAIFQVFVVCVFGYIAARAKILTPQAQKHIANLNVFLFTPCLIFSKLASSLSLQKMLEVAIIPLLFVLMTLVSLACANLMGWVLKLNKNQSNFVKAMAVFGNSNSLPVSLTMALSYTLPNLSWDQIPNDNPDQVASRGILYLLIFQQLGQIVRWSWGYNTLLRYADEEVVVEEDEEITVGVEVHEQSPLLIKDAQQGILLNSDEEGGSGDTGGTASTYGSHVTHSSESSDHDNEHVVGSGHTTACHSADHSTNSSQIDLHSYQSSPAVEEIARKPRRKSHKKKHGHKHRHKRRPNVVVRVAKAVLNFMNPPLWAMLVAIVVASVPILKYEFFESNDIVQATITKAIQQLGSVAIPLILVVLGSNLSPDSGAPPACKNYKKMVFGAIMARMILPAFVLLPLIAWGVKYSEVSILDDPIFLLVSFILTIAPPAIQLSQICQLNGFYEKEMAGVLFWGYVVLTLPTTLFIVVSSLEVLDWAGKLVS